MVLSQGTVRHAGRARTSLPSGSGCGGARTAPDVGTGCGSGNSSRCWERTLWAQPSRPVGRTALSCCLGRQRVCRSKLPLGRVPGTGPGAPVQECPAESAECSRNGPLLTVGCLRSRRTVGRRGTRTLLPHRRCRPLPRRPRTLPRQRTDAPPVPLRHRRAHHFLSFLHTQEDMQ